MTDSEQRMLEDAQRRQRELADQQIAAERQMDNQRRFEAERMMGGYERAARSPVYEEGVLTPDDMNIIPPQDRRPPMIITSEDSPNRLILVNTMPEEAGASMAVVDHRPGSSTNGNICYVDGEDQGRLVMRVLDEAERESEARLAQNFTGPWPIQLPEQLAGNQNLIRWVQQLGFRAIAPAIGTNLNHTYTPERRVSRADILSQPVEARVDPPQDNEAFVKILKADSLERLETRLNAFLNGNSSWELVGPAQGQGLEFFATVKNTERELQNAAEPIPGERFVRRVITED